MVKKCNGYPRLPRLPRVIHWPSRQTGPKKRADCIAFPRFSDEASLPYTSGEGAQAEFREVPLMKVHRTVANIQTAEVAKADLFYRGVLGLKLVMDHGWIRTYGSSEKMTVQVSFATQGGSDTPVPDLSVEVDDIELALAGVRKAGLPVEYGPKSEPWGVRRFYVRDPLGTLVNVMQHE